MRAPLRLLAPVVAAVLGTACGDTLVDEDFPGLELPSNGCVETTRCGEACEDCTTKVVPADSVAACLGEAGEQRTCGHACTGGRLRCGSDADPACCAATAIVAGDQHTCALTTEGGISCWGRNEAGQVTGASSGPPVRTPSRVALSGVVTAAAAGYDRTCAVMAGTGAVECWGAGLPVAPVPGISGATALAVGQLHACAIVAAGQVRCWGAADRIAGGTPVASGAIAIAAGWEHTCALVVTDGGAREVRCWGASVSGWAVRDPITGGPYAPEYRGQLGALEPPPPESVVTVGGLAPDITALSAGRFHSCAARAAPSEASGVNDAVKCWGDARTAPSDAGFVLFGLDAPQLTPEVPTEADGDAVIRKRMVAVAGGRSHVCVQRPQEGSIPAAIECFGAESSLGQLGGLPTSPTETVTVPVPGPIAFAVGADHGCAITSITGGVRCWGANEVGQLGDGFLNVRPIGVVVEISGR